MPQIESVPPSGLARYTRRPPSDDSARRLPRRPLLRADWGKSTSERVTMGGGAVRGAPRWPVTRRPQPRWRRQCPRQRAPPGPAAARAAAAPPASTACGLLVASASSARASAISIRAERIESSRAAGILLQTPLQQPAHFGGRRRRQQREVGRVAQHRRNQLARIAPGERAAAASASRRARTPNAQTSVRLSTGSPAGLLGRHVGGRAEDHAAAVMRGRR